MGFNSAFKELKLLKNLGNGRLNNLNDPVLNVLISLPAIFDNFFFQLHRFSDKKKAFPPFFYSAFTVTVIIFSFSLCLSLSLSLSLYFNISSASVLSPCTVFSFRATVENLVSIYTL